MARKVVNIRSEDDPARKLIHMVLLLAIKDHARLIEFAPSAIDNHWKIRCQVANTWYDMVPAPIHIPIFAEIRRLLQPSLIGRLGGLLRGMTRGRVEQTEQLHLLIVDQPMEVDVFIEPPGTTDARRWKTVTLRLPDHLPSEQAQRLLTEYIERCPPLEEDDMQA